MKRSHRIQRDSNPGPLGLESNALPSELLCFGKGRVVFASALSCSFFLLLVSVSVCDCLKKLHFWKVGQIFNHFYSVLIVVYFDQ